MLLHLERKWLCDWLLQTSVFARIQLRLTHTKKAKLPNPKLAVIQCTENTTIIRIGSLQSLYFVLHGQGYGGLTNKLTGTPMAAFLSKGLKQAERK
jgi:ribosomal protein S11